MKMEITHGCLYVTLWNYQFFLYRHELLRAIRLAIKTEWLSREQIEQAMNGGKTCGVAAKK